MERHIVNVEGVEVFSAEWTMTQMMALMSSIERLKAKNRFLMVISVISFLLSIFAIVSK